MTEIITYSKIGAQDLARGTGTFTVTLPDGSVATLDEINLVHFPIPEYAYADLPASPAAGALARVSDGGRGLYVYQGDQWVHLTGGVVSVKWFGAKGDGTTDDTAAIQAALTAAAAASPGTVIYFPPGMYRINATLTIPAAKYIQFLGSGMRSTILDWRGANNGRMLHIDVNVSAPATTGVRVAGFDFSNTINATGVTALTAGKIGGGGLGLQDCQVDHNLFRDVAIAIQCEGEIDSLNIHDNWIYGVTTGITNAGTVGPTSNITIWRNSIGQTTGNAVELTGSRHTVSENFIQSASAAFGGIVCNNCDSLTVAGNYFESNSAAVAGPFLTLNATTAGSSAMNGAVITGNHIDYGTARPDQIAISIANADGVYLAGNAFNKVQVGIQFAATVSNSVVAAQSWGTGVVTKFNDLGATNPVILDPAVGISLPSFTSQGSISSTTAINTISGSVNIANGATTTIFTAADAGNGSTYLVTITEGVNNNDATCICSLGEGGTTAVQTTIRNSSASLVFAISGTSLQVTNNLGGVRTVSYRAIRIM